MRMTALAMIVTVTAGAAWAQETTSEETANEAAQTEETVEATEAEAQPVPPGGALSTGEPVGPQPGQIYQRETHGDWQVRCVKAPEGSEDACQLFQQLADAEGNPTAEANFLIPPNGSGVAGGATFVTPLRTLLTAGLVMQVDGGAQRRYPFTFCDPQGCYARLGFSANEMAGFRRGNVAKVTIVPALAPDQSVDMEMSLTGFTAGFQALAE